MSGRMTDQTLACGPAAARFYVDNGLRVVPLHATSKEGARKGFGKAFPEYCCPPENFKADELTAILFGPCPLGNFAGGRLLCGLDLDAPFDRAALEAALGPLPVTLTSKQERHLYFWITPEQNARGPLTQGNNIFCGKLDGKGACDLRPAAGGYFLERGEWDGGFDRTRIADLPDRAFNALLAARSRTRGRPKAPCPVELRAFEGDEQSPLNSVPEERVDALARALGALWPRPGQGGGHDLALALGGILADCYGSLDDVCDFASRTFYYAKAPNDLNEVAASVERRRSGAGGAFGWPTLKRMLIEAQAGRAEPATERQINAVLSQMRRVLPGLDRTATARGAAMRAFEAAGWPGAETLGRVTAFEAWLAARATEKDNAPEPTSSGALPQPTENEGN